MQTSHRPQRRSRGPPERNSWTGRGCTGCGTCTSGSGRHCSHRTDTYTHIYIHTHTESAQSERKPVCQTATEEMSSDPKWAPAVPVPLCSAPSLTVCSAKFFLHTFYTERCDTCERESARQPSSPESDRARERRSDDDSEDTA